MDIEFPFATEIAERFDSLYQLLSRKYRIEENTYDLGERKYRIISVKNLDDLLNEIIKLDPNHVEVKDERLPYWAEIWPSSLALSRFILDSGMLGRGTSVLELGCGLGLVGMAALDAGADVLFTDYQPDALRFSELNCLLNLGKSSATALMDWRQPDLKSRFEVILASDVAYEKRFFWPLIDTFNQLLRPGGHVYLSEPNRKVANKFLDMLREEGFVLKKTDIQVKFRGKAPFISVYDIWKSR
ncbi:MAG: methyltransferase domain-containing protein [Calditrichia bacterium]